MTTNPREEFAPFNRSQPIQGDTHQAMPRRVPLRIGAGRTPMYSELEDAYIDLNERSKRVIKIAATHQDDPQWLEVLELLSPAPPPATEGQVGFFELMRDQFGLFNQSEAGEQA